MSDFQRQYALWDEFLATWPRTRLATMTLDAPSVARTSFLPVSTSL